MYVGTISDDSLLPSSVAASLHGLGLMSNCSVLVQRMFHYDVPQFGTCILKNSSKFLVELCGG